MEGGPWIYDNMYILRHHLKPNEAPAAVPLDSLDFSIQIHNLPVGFMSTQVGKQFDDFVGKFIQYDETNNTRFGASYMQVKVQIDVLQPLKRWKYERLGLFCLLCGKLGHTERFCDFHFSMVIDSMARGWGNWLKASFRASYFGRGWLRDEKGESIHSDGVIPETSSVFPGSLVPTRQSISSDLVTVDVRKALDSPVHHLQPINSIPTTPKNSDLAHVQLASDENMEVDLQDDRKRRREGVLAMAMDSSGKALVTTDDSPSGLDKYSSSVFDLAKCGAGSPTAMSCLSWNCRGLGNLRVVRSLCDFVKSHVPVFFFSWKH